MRVNLCANRYQSINSWNAFYEHVYNVFKDLGYDVYKSKHLTFNKDIPIIDSDSDEYIYVYNHLTIEELKQTNFNLGKKTLIIKPTGPTPKHFTIDTLGYACCSSITYKKPNYEEITKKEANDFFNNEIKKYKEKRIHKWSDTNEVNFSNDKIKLPKEHILVMGQMPGDETVTKFSFGNHWEKLKSIVESVKYLGEVVVKLHPSLIIEVKKSKVFSWDFYLKTIKKWQSEGITVLYEQESLYDVLENTKVAIIENSTSGVDCMMHDIPIISYGYPEYHWITKDIRHLIQLRDAIEDMSWFNKVNSRKWLTWYSKKHQCYDYQSTKNRILEIMT